MSKLLHIKKFLCKVFTCCMPYKLRILYRDALYWFSFPDYWRFKHANYHIVSLGANCLPRGLTTAAKLKPRRFYGEKTCVFDLYISNLKRNIANFPNIIQLPEKFTIDDGCWLVHIINEYGDYDNKYTQYCKKMKEKLSSVFVTKN